MKTGKYTAILTAMTLLAVSAQAQSIFWGGGSGDWSVAENWSTTNVPDTTIEVAYFAGIGNAINIDADFTTGGMRANFAAQEGTNTLSGTGTLTINGNVNNVLGFSNQAGGAGGTMILNANMVVNNTGGNGLTFVRNDNGPNATVFGPGSTLTLNTLLSTHPGAVAGNTIEFSGTLAPSLASLRIGGPNVSFGAGHDSTAFGQDIVFLSTAGGVPKLAVNGGTVLAANRKLQVNSSGELELNGANAWNGANIVVGAANNLLLDVNSDQANIGTVSVGTGLLTIDVDAGVTDLFFANSSENAWGGTVTINGFQEGVIKFGSDASGLTAAQLSVIDGGAYTLTNQGYLTVIPEPATLGLLLIGGMGLFAKRRMKK